MRKIPSKNIIYGIIPFILFIIAWIFLTEIYHIKEIFLPAIPKVFKTLGDLFAKENYIIDVLVSCYRVIIAFLISAFFAIPIGLFAGHFKKVSKTVEPFVGFFRYLPVPALVPLCILWFGLGHSGKIAIIFLGTFFQLILMIADVGRDVPKSLFEAALTLGAKRKHLLLKVLWPASRPGIINASRIAIGWAWTYLVVAEIAGATSGLGFRIMQAQRYVQAPQIYAGIVVIGFLGVTTDLLFKAFYKVMLPWIES